MEIQTDVMEKYGDSMNRVIPDGTVAIFHKTEDINSEDICAVIINGNEATLKHMYKTPNRILFEPDSYSSEHKPFEYTEDMDVEVKVIEKYLYAVLGR